VTSTVNPIEVRHGVTMHLNSKAILRIAAFVLATLGATGALVAAGLNDETSAPAAQASHSR
jgi:hypothetical protein